MSENAFRWLDNKQCAVSLTYDDGLPIQPSYTAPSLTEAGLRATFYLELDNLNVEIIPRWREAAASGHELGNHTIFHSCRKTAKRPWVMDWMDWAQYTPDRFRAEMEVVNTCLHLLDGKTERTYGNTCCDTTIGSGENEIQMDELLRPYFVAARGPQNEKIAQPADGINLMQIGHFSGDVTTRPVSAVKALIEQSAQSGGWIVFNFHGIGKETHPLHMEKSAHEELVAWLKARQDQYWIAPLIDIAKYVRNYSSPLQEVAGEN